jgi:hypothetical protein
MVWKDSAMKLPRMSRGCIVASLSGLLLTGFGCANTSVIGDNTSRGGRVFGEAGITGDGNTFTVERGSRIHHFSIIGNKNNVLVEEGASLRKVEVWGSNNVVSVPDNTTIRLTEVGKGNRIERRPADWDAPAVDTAALHDAMTAVPISAPAAPPPAAKPAAATPAAATPTPVAGANYTAPPATRTNP